MMLRAVHILQTFTQDTRESMSDINVASYQQHVETE